MSENLTERAALQEVLDGHRWDISKVPVTRCVCGVSLHDMTAHVVDEVLAAGFHRTPTPATVTTVEGDGDTEWEIRKAVCLARNHRGDAQEDPECREFADRVIEHLPATVLTPTPAPIDREALRVAIFEELVNDRRLGVDQATWNIADDVLDAIEGVDR